MSNCSIDPAKINIPDDAWEFVDATEDFVRHRAPLERYADGNVMYVYRRTPRGLGTMLEDNRRLLDDSDGKRFGEDGRIVGRIPMNVLYQNADRLRDGDKDWMKWFLNDPENRMYRTFRGRI